MKTYAVTGGVNGIGKATVEILKGEGHRVICIDNEGGDIVADLGTKQGRKYAVDEIKRLCPEGLDGIACIAGISAPKPTNGRVLSINYWGAIEVADGVFDLLEKKKGCCIMITSASLTWPDKIDPPNLANLITDCGDEERIVHLVNSFPNDSPYVMYSTSKIALLRWVRRHSIEWGARGVRLNAIGPGCVNTRLGVAPPGVSVNESFHQTIPMHYNELSIMEPEDIGETIAFVLSEKANGISGSVLWVDAGQESFYHTERIV